MGWRPTEENIVGRVRVGTIITLITHVTGYLGRSASPSKVINISRQFDDLDSLRIETVPYLGSYVLGLLRDQ